MTYANEVINNLDYFMLITLSQFIRNCEILFVPLQIFLNAP